MMEYYRALFTIVFAVAFSAPAFPASSTDSLSRKILSADVVIVAEVASIVVEPVDAEYTHQRIRLRVIELVRGETISVDYIETYHLVSPTIEFSYPPGTTLLACLEECIGVEDACMVYRYGTFYCDVSDPVDYADVVGRVHQLTDVALDYVNHGDHAGLAMWLADCVIEGSRLGGYLAAAELVSGNPELITFLDATRLAALRVAASQSLDQPIGDYPTLLVLCRYFQGDPVVIEQLKRRIRRLYRYYERVGVPTRPPYQVVALTEMLAVSMEWDAGYMISQELTGALFGGDLNSPSPTHLPDGGWYRAFARYVQLMTEFE